MKYTAVTWVLFVSSRVHARLLGKKERMSARSYGYSNAEALWTSNGAYPCNLDGVTRTFWTDVKLNVFPLCDYVYELDGERIARACKNGAEKFAYNQLDPFMGNCITKSDCTELGKRIANGLAATFCTGNRAGKQGEFLPNSCKIDATASCQVHVVEAINDSIARGECFVELRDDEKAQQQTYCAARVQECSDVAGFPW